MVLCFFYLFIFRFTVCDLLLWFAKDPPDSEPSSSDSSNNLIDLKREGPSIHVEALDKINSLPSQKSNISLPLPSTSNYPMLVKTPSKNHISSSLQNFASRSIKHHSFDSDLDVKYMEKNLISLLDDFHNGKILRKFECLKFQRKFSRKTQSIFR